MPCTSSSLSRCSMLIPEFFASSAAVSVDITTSPNNCGLRYENSPSRIGKAITLVGPLRLRYFKFSFSIWESSTIRMEISPSGQSNAPKMTFTDCSIFSSEIPQELCRSFIRTSISCSSFVVCAGRCSFFDIFDSMMVNTI